MKNLFKILALHLLLLPGLAAAQIKVARWTGAEDIQENAEAGVSPTMELWLSSWDQQVKPQSKEIRDKYNAFVEAYSKFVENIGQRDEYAALSEPRPLSKDQLHRGLSDDLIKNVRATFEDCSTPATIQKLHRDPYVDFYDRHNPLRYSVGSAGYVVNDAVYRNCRDRFKFFEQWMGNGNPLVQASVIDALQFIASWNRVFYTEDEPYFAAELAISDLHAYVRTLTDSSKRTRINEGLKRMLSVETVQPIQELIKDAENFDGSK